MEFLSQLDAGELLKYILGGVAVILSALVTAVVTLFQRRETEHTKAIDRAQERFKDLQTRYDALHAKYDELLRADDDS